MTDDFSNSLSLFFFFFNQHLFSPMYTHIKASSSNSLSRHIAMMGMEKILSLEKRTSRPKAPNLLLLSSAMNCCSYLAQPDSWLSWLITLHRWKANVLKERIESIICKAPLGLFNILCTSFVHTCLWVTRGRKVWERYRTSKNIIKPKN